MSFRLLFISVLFLQVGTGVSVQASESDTKTSVVAEEAEITKTKIVTKYTYGNASGMCNGGVFANFCIDQLKDQAKRDGIRQAETSCSIDGGRLDPYSGSCWGNCSPMYIPDNQSAFVTCSLSCDADCYIEVPDEESK
jgi:hypothetical protein